MPLYLGSKTVSENINMGDTVIQNTFDLFDVKWSDHIINNESWMCADDFNWIDGTVFSAAWNELKSEWDLATIDSTLPETETIGTVTISYWRSPKGYKLVNYGGDTPEEREQWLEQVYAETGIAWYYLIDTTGQIRFKLPRTKYGFVGVRSGAGNFVDESLPQHTHFIANYGGIATGGGFMSYASSAAPSTLNSGKVGDSSVYQDGANVQQKSTEMHLYFYLADFVRTPLESNLNTFITETKETLNEKVNVSDYSADKTTIENDIKQLDDSAAKLGEDNTFTGVNTFESATSNVYIKSSSIDITSTPSSTQYSYLDFYDKNNQRLGVIGAFQFTTGEYGVYLQAGNVASLNIRTNGTNSYTSVATPPTSDNSTQIATTAFVNNKFQVVSTLPASPNANVYYFVTNA